MSARDAYKTSKAREETGVEIELRSAPGCFLTLRRQGGFNKSWAKSVEKHTKDIRRLLDAKVHSEALTEKSNAAFKRAFVESIVTGWRGFSVYDLTGDESKRNETLSFSVENCAKLFEEIPDIYLEAEEESRKLENFKEEALKAEAGN